MADARVVVQFGAEPYRIVDTGEAVVVEVNAGPDAMGSRVWVGVVDAGGALAALARTLAASNEFRALVEAVAVKQAPSPGRKC